MWKPPECTVSGGFFLLTAWFALSCGWETALLALSAAGLHELGHLLALQACGTSVRRLRVGILGAAMEVSGSMSYAQELTAVLAGPLTNLLWALLLGRYGLSAWAGAHAVLCAFNLLPVRPLDGGQGLYLLLCWAAGPQTAEWVSHWIGLLTAAAAACGAAYLAWVSGGTLWLLPAAIGLVWFAASTP